MNIPQLKTFEGIDGSEIKVYIGAALEVVFMAKKGEYYRYKHFSFILDYKEAMSFCETITEMADYINELKRRQEEEDWGNEQ